MAIRQIKKNNKEQYGLPYQGSKTKIISEIAKFFPNADNFYDLFGGGFSVSHYMLENRSKSYKEFHYNELRHGLCELIQDAIAGKYNYNNFKPEWITRERFMKEKESNIYIKIIWSFGNDGSSYIFGKEIEQQKRSMHQAIIFNEFDQWFVDTFKFNSWPGSLDIFGRRIYLRSKCVGRIDLQRLQQLQQLERLQQLEQLEQLHFTNLDYRMVNINPNSVIYCDIPYKSTKGYGSSFSHGDFFDWAASQSNPLFISEYNVDDSRFHLIKEINHRTTMSAEKSNAKVVERLYCNQIAFDMIKQHRSKHGKT